MARYSYQLLRRAAWRCWRRKSALVMAALWLFLLFGCSEAKNSAVAVAPAKRPNNEGLPSADDGLSGRKVRTLAYGTPTYWIYSGEVEILQRPSSKWQYCGEGFCAHGYGRVGTDGGYSYEGTFVHGRPEGQGTASHDFYEYVGNFGDGRFSGEGQLTCFRNGRRFKGTFVDGMLSGKDWMALCGFPRTP